MDYRRDSSLRGLYRLIPHQDQRFLSSTSQQSIATPVRSNPNSSFRGRFVSFGKQQQRRWFVALFLGAVVGIRSRIREDAFEELERAQKDSLAI